MASNGKYIAIQEAFSNTLEAPKCIICKNYLSIPPIFIITEDGSGQKCGRCKDIKTDIIVRNVAYENISKHLTFPCIYPKCTASLSWDGIEAHEMICPHATIHCPYFYWACNEIIEVAELENHILNKHDTSNLYNLEFNFTFPKKRNILRCVVKNKFPYLIYIGTNPDDFIYIAVFSVMPNSKCSKYQVRLTMDASKGTYIMLPNQSITMFNEREHCPRCVYGKCDIKCHRYSKENESQTNLLEKIITTQIEYSVTNFLKLNCKDIVIKLDITEDEKTTGINTIHYSNSKLLVQYLVCPVCEENTSPPIYQCKTGHSVCHLCKPKLCECPLCKVKYCAKDTRNFVLEAMAENVKLSCHNEDQGCKFIGNVKKIQEHEIRCQK